MNGLGEPAVKVDTVGCIWGKKTMRLPSSNSSVWYNGEKVTWRQQLLQNMSFGRCCNFLRKRKTKHDRSIRNRTLQGPLLDVNAKGCRTSSLVACQRGSPAKSRVRHYRLKTALIKAMLYLLPLSTKVNVKRHFPRRETKLVFSEQKNLVVIHLLCVPRNCLMPEETKICFDCKGRTVESCNMFSLSEPSLHRSEVGLSFVFSSTGPEAAPFFLSCHYLALVWGKWSFQICAALDRFSQGSPFHWGRSFKQSNVNGMAKPPSRSPLTLSLRWHDKAKTLTAFRKGIFLRVNKTFIDIKGKL